MTKATDTNSLLGITLSDGTTITPATNTSTTGKPIKLPNDGDNFANVGMLVPISTDSIALSDLISAPYNYWGDDDGDGQGTNGITASGNLSVSITDKDNQTVSRSAALDICQAPYKVQLTSTTGSLTTQYGVPNSSSFSGSTTTYYISPKAEPKICYARPYLNWGTGDNAGPTTIWSPTKGFLVQSIEPSSYYRNFPTTGANNLYFDLDIGGVNGSALTWPTISQSGITATMTPSPYNANNIRVTLTGPVATSSQIFSDSPGSVATPTLPQTFEIVGYNSNHTVVLKYGFVLKQWFINRATKKETSTNQSSWCTKLGSGYHLPQVKDLTNAVCSGTDVRPNYPCTGAVGATPSSTINNYQRNIGAGFFTEWGQMSYYASTNYYSGSFWTNESNGTNPFAASSNNGMVISADSINRYSAVCVYP